MDNDEAPEDVVLLHSATEDGEGIRVVRARNGQKLETGEVRVAREGKPLTGELVGLTPRKDAPWLCDVKSLYDAKHDTKHEPEKAAKALPQNAGSSGPAQVATRAYRASWDRIFGPRGPGAPN